MRERPSEGLEEGPPDVGVQSVLPKEPVMARVITEVVEVPMTNEELEVFLGIAQIYKRSLPDTIRRLAGASAKNLLKEME